MRRGAVDGGRAGERHWRRSHPLPPSTTRSNSQVSGTGHPPLCLWCQCWMFDTTAVLSNPLAILAPSRAKSEARMGGSGRVAPSEVGIAGIVCIVAVGLGLSCSEYLLRWCWFSLGALCLCHLAVSPERSNNQIQSSESHHFHFAFPPFTFRNPQKCSSNNSAKCSGSFSSHFT